MRAGGSRGGRPGGNQGGRARVGAKGSNPIITFSARLNEKKRGDTPLKTASRGDTFDGERERPMIGKRGKKRKTPPTSGWGGGGASRGLRLQLICARRNKNFY